MTPSESISANPLVKVRFDLPSDAPTPVETLWAEPLGESLYRLDNTPWYAKGCALDDVIRCEETAEDLPRFVDVVRPSGNRTVRVFVPDGAARQSIKQRLFDYLARTGCVYEGMAEAKGLIAVTVPKSVDLNVVLSVLNEMESKGEAYWQSGNF